MANAVITVTVDGKSETRNFADLDYHGVGHMWDALNKVSRKMNDLIFARPNNHKHIPSGAEKVNVAFSATFTGDFKWTLHSGGEVTAEDAGTIKQFLNDHMNHLHQDAAKKEKKA